MIPEQISSEVVSKGKFTQRRIITWMNSDGERLKWESVERVDSQSAVVIAAWTSDCLVIVRQYRPCVDAFVYELPAGLIDDGESPRDAAMRELKEETGFVGEILSVSDPVATSAGLTSEMIYMVEVGINDEESKNLGQDLDENEDIEVSLLPISGGVKGFVDDAREEGAIIGSRLYAYLMGICGTMS